MDATVSNTLRRMTGGAALAEMLKLAGAGPIFGMGGFQLLPFYEACRALGLRHVLINDERCGAFAADAYARVTNRPGLCDGTLGPGATNLTTGLIEALNAGMPMIAVIGGANRQHAWKNMTQEARQFDILRPAAKDAIRIEVTARVPELLRRAFAVATSGRPGPVLIEVPEDVAHNEHDFDAAEFWIDPGTLKAQARRTRPDPDLLAAAGRLLAEADRPLILAGGGVHLSEAYDALLRLAEAEGIPVAHTMSGKGAIPCTHALSAGLFGRYDRIANAMIAESDCLLVVGCKLGEIATRRFALIPPGKRLIHIDILPEEIGRTTRADVALAADARLALSDLADFLADGDARLRRRAEWVASVPRRMARWREGARERLESTERPINVGRLMGALNRVLPADAVLVADGGFAAHWGGLFFDTKQPGRSFVPDRGFASIGYGVPGGIGAQLGVGPKRRVVALTGDGGFNMSMGELETARRLGAPIVVCIFNNAASGYVKALQHAVFGPGNYQSSDLAEMDYAAVARAMGCHGIRVEDPEALEGALREGLANTTSPTVLDIVVTRDPARMLPGVDNRTLTVQKGDRPV
ncbi:thiamine pyrophosphate-binding protein [Elioraea sp.]|uniref:thiamine pyrophosphate-binding protein n=1 Tax=Elioraea sp. TaxID=2185103 RepID=UPI0021DE3A07|nr:thiamine pyrophosphate-binding protein [Elioraea sp.]GIX11533.1 MAG: acetolactate synthase [Elioraea sp.]